MAVNDESTFAYIPTSPHVLSGVHKTHLVGSLGYLMYTGEYIRYPRYHCLYRILDEQSVAVGFHNKLECQY